jgi:hypothetical protein
MPLFGRGKHTENPDIDKMTRKHDVKGLCKALCHENFRVRLQASWALSQIGDKRALEPLTAALKDPNAGVRNNAVIALADISMKTLLTATTAYSAALEPLTAALSEPDAAVREEAARALGNIYIRISFLPQRTAREIYVYARALGEMSHIIEPLIGTLKDPNAAVRKEAARSLGLFRDRRAVEALKALSEQHGEERSAIYKFDNSRVQEALESPPLICANCDRQMQRPKSMSLDQPRMTIGSPEALAAFPLECPECHLIFCASCAKSMSRQAFRCPRCGGGLLDVMTKTLVAYMSEATFMKEQEMLNVLRRLCNAYMNYDAEKPTIAKLEPLATDIGWELHRRGGIQEMRRIFQKLGGIPGSRTLEMHWNGIGDWRG